MVINDAPIGLDPSKSLFIDHPLVILVAEHHLIAKQRIWLEWWLFDKAIFSGFTMIVEHPLNPLPIFKKVLLQQRENLFTKNLPQSFQRRVAI
ncbi:hypothetical protein D9M69_570150 [compost metagenome]